MSVIDTTSAGDPVLLIWSAPTERAELALRERLVGRVAGSTGPRLAETAAAVAAQADPSFPVRGALIVDGSPAACRRDTAARGVRRIDDRPARPVAFMLPGHGSQYPRMGARLYGREPVFTANMDRFFSAYSSGADGDRLRTDWLATDPETSIDTAQRSQPLLFALGYALTRTIMSWGVNPSALIGHSIGEFAAAAVAGVVGMTGAARLLGTCEPSYAAAAAGGLLAVAAAPDAVAGVLPPDAVIGMVNAPTQCVVAGTEPALRVARERLVARGYACVRVPGPVPFHSPLVRDLGTTLARSLTGLALGRPGIPIYSTRTARPVSAAEAVEPRFWAEQVASPVLFWAGLDRLLADGDVLLVEVGPGRTLTRIARRHPALVAGRSDVIPSLPTPQRAVGDDRRHLLCVAARTWLEGHRLHPPAVR